MLPLSSFRFPGPFSLSGPRSFLGRRGRIPQSLVPGPFRVMGYPSLYSQVSSVGKGRGPMIWVPPTIEYRLNLHNSLVC